VWERWNGDTGDPSMNSYNHYAFGSVMAWVYRYAAGIDTTPDSPGFKEIVIHPHLDARMKRCAFGYDSIYGKIVSDWKGSPAGPFSLNVTIPANTSAKFSCRRLQGLILCRRKPMEAQAENGSFVVEIGSGSYNFEVKLVFSAGGRGLRHELLQADTGFRLKPLNHHAWSFAAPYRHDSVPFG